MYEYHKENFRYLFAHNTDLPAAYQYLKTHAEQDIHHFLEGLLTDHLSSAVYGSKNADPDGERVYDFLSVYWFIWEAYNLWQTHNWNGLLDQPIFVETKRGMEFNFPGHQVREYLFAGDSPDLVLYRIWACAVTHRRRDASQYVAMDQLAVALGAWHDMLRRLYQSKQIYNARKYSDHGE